MTQATLTSKQIQALNGFAASRGRYWKAALRQAWETGNYLGFEQSNDLQTIRNQFGPSWLISFNLKTATVSKEQLQREQFQAVADEALAAYKLEQTFDVFVGNIVAKEARWT